MGRLVAIDLARTVAIIGMMAAHLLAIGQVDGVLVFLTSGFPSTLFAVLGGFGVFFASRRYLEADRLGAAVLAGCVRGGMVVVVGLVLELLPPHPIAVVLIYFGMAIMVGSVLILIPQIQLAVILGFAAVAVPLVEYWAEARFPTAATHGTLDYSGPGQFLITSWFTGTYPVATWTIYLGVGIIAARFLLSAASLRVRAAILALAGLLLCAFAQAISEWRVRGIASRLVSTPEDQAEIAAVLRSSGHDTAYVSGWDLLLVADPHSSSTGDIVRTAAAAIVLIAVLVALLGSRSRLPVVLQPVAVLGSVPLTSYSLHVAMTAFWLFLSGALVRGGWPEAIAVLHDSFWWQVGVLLVLATALTALGKRGPLETLVSWAARSVATTT